jgi:hypothetical protein
VIWRPAARCRRTPAIVDGNDAATAMHSLNLTIRSLSLAMVLTTITVCPPKSTKVQNPYL